MSQIKKGDIVGRKSYGKDIIFIVSNILETPKKKIAILRGVIERIEADSEIEDLELIDNKEIREKTKIVEDRIEARLENTKRARPKITTGKILHLDGDKKYSEKSYRYYKKLGINAIVRNIPEFKQPKVVYQLLKMYDPDILVITRT